MSSSPATRKGQIVIPRNALLGAKHQAPTRNLQLFLVAQLFARRRRQPNMKNARTLPLSRLAPRKSGCHSEPSVRIWRTWVRNLLFAFLDRGGPPRGFRRSRNSTPLCHLLSGVGALLAAPAVVSSAAASSTEFLVSETLRSSPFFESSIIPSASLVGPARVLVTRHSLALRWPAIAGVLAKGHRLTLLFRPGGTLTHAPSCFDCVHPDIFIVLDHRVRSNH